MQTLIALLVPGTVFCLLMAAEQIQHERKPHIRFGQKDLPIWACYVIVMIGGPLLLVLMLADALRKGRGY